VENGLVCMQHKHFSSDERGPIQGHLCMNSLLGVAEKLELTQVFAVDQREIKVLDKFVAQGKFLQRGINPKKNFEAVQKTRLFKDYLSDFLQSNRERFRDLPFWPSNVSNENDDGVLYQMLEKQVQLQVKLRMRMKTKQECIYGLDYGDYA